MADKRASLDEIRALAADYRAQGKCVVFTNGCFDILHAGHVSYLAKAKACGDVLVLGLNSDASVRGIKGDKKPVISEDQRAIVMSALEMVDHVVLFEEPDPENLIHAVVPQVLVKGADWPEDQIIGGDFVKANGGRVERIAFEQNISTTKIIERIGRRFYGAS
ncbi:MAG TPA: D-glycero-beta-D-manno-heptose 1-phosphate adenylyltransferase [Desulfobacteraceae bacterium]|nr:D-glycero-beta-D-manno-heptose 1-phosphate adenylyltransferase [Desulfobacteraceae bacterium]